MITNTRRRTIVFDEHDSDGTWAVSYGDMVTLLLCFFIIFFSVDPKRDEANKLDNSLIQHLTISKSKQEKVAHGSATLNVGDKKEKGIDEKVLKQWDGVAKKVGHQIVIYFPNISFFNSGKTELTKEGKKALKDFAKVYSPYAGRYKMRVQATTDTKAVMAKKDLPFKNNLELSVFRSLNAMQTLISTGIPLYQIRLAGLGELKTTIENVENLPKEKITKTTALDLARKIIIVIETDNGGPS